MEAGRFWGSFLVGARYLDFRGCALLGPISIISRRKNRLNRLIMIGVPTCPRLAGSFQVLKTNCDDYSSAAVPAGEKYIGRNERCREDANKIQHPHPLLLHFVQNQHMLWWLKERILNDTSNDGYRRLNIMVSQ